MNSGILLATDISGVFSDRVIEIFLRALIDPYSQTSFISGLLCQRLKFKTTNGNVPITGTCSISLSVRNSAQVLIKPRFDLSCSYLVDTFILQSVSSYSSPSMNSTLVLPHLSGLVLAVSQYLDKSYIDGLWGAAIYTLIVKGALIKGNLNEPTATPYTLVCWLSAERPFIGTYELLIIALFRLFKIVTLVNFHKYVIHRQ